MDRRRPSGFLNDPDYHFEFFLTEQIGGGNTRAQFMGRMSNREFVAWSRYYALKAQQEDLEAKKAAARARRRR